MKQKANKRAKGRKTRGSYLAPYLKKAYAQIRKQHGYRKNDIISKTHRMKAMKLAHQLRNK